MDDPAEPIQVLITPLLVGNLDVGFLISLVLLLVLLGMSALVSGSEVAYFSLTPSHRKELEDSETRNASLVNDLLDKSKGLLATILISNNFINVAIILLAAMVSGYLFTFEDQQVAGIFLSAETQAFLVDVGLITFLILLIGEVIPKVYASRYPMELALIMALPLTLAYRLFRQLQLIPLLVKSTNFLDRRIKKRSSNLSVDQLSHALEITDTGEIPEEDHRMLKGIVKFGNTEARQIMKPRVDVEAHDITTPYPELLKSIIKAGFSRIPIYEENFDNIKGVLYLKDLLPHIEAPADFEWQKLLREPFYVPENKKIDDLLNEFRERKIHMAIVVDEYGGSQGIVTLEDVIEEIVGDISDEFDDEDLVSSKLDESNYIFEGKIPLPDMCRVLGLEVDTFESVRGEAETLAGMVIEVAGKIPKKNEKARIPGFTFTIDAADRKRIRRVKVTLEAPEPEETPSRKSFFSFTWLVLIVLVAGMLGCREDYIPKPRAYHRIEMPEPDYQMLDTDCPFTFAYSNQAQLDYTRLDTTRTPCWFNLYYPAYQSRIHFSFFQESIQDSLSVYTENSHRLITKHMVKAQDILEDRIYDDTERVYGLTYDFVGSTASNFQFFLTDSTNYFLHASMYFELPPAPDSLQPVEQYIKRDLYRLIETFRWKE